MPREPIAADIQGFIVRYIESIAQLEALLLLQANPDRPWTPGRVAERLYAGEADMQTVLSHLCDHRLAVFEADAYRYERATPFSGTVDRLAEAYRNQLVAVTNFVHANQRRIRGSSGATPSPPWPGDAGGENP